MLAIATVPCSPSNEAPPRKTPGGLTLSVGRARVSSPKGPEPPEAASAALGIGDHGQHKHALTEAGHHLVPVRTALRDAELTAQKGPASSKTTAGCHRQRDRDLFANGEGR